MSKGSQYVGGGGSEHEGRMKGKSVCAGAVCSCVFTHTLVATHKAGSLFACHFKVTMFR